MIHAAAEVKSALRVEQCGTGSGGGGGERKRGGITIQNLLNEFKNSYFSAFAIQSLRLGLRRGGKKKKKKNFHLHSYPEPGGAREEEGASR